MFIIITIITTNTTTTTTAILIIIIASIIIIVTTTIISVSSSSNNNNTNNNISSNNIISIIISIINIITNIITITITIAIVIEKKTINLNWMIKLKTIKILKRERDEREKKITGDKPIIVRWHVQPRKEKVMTKNKMRWRKHIFHHWKSPHTPTTFLF